MSEIPRFLVFGYDQYYPGGGWRDIEAAFHTEQEAQSYVAACKVRPRFDAVLPRCDYYDIIDLHDPANFRKALAHAKEQA